MFDVVYFFVFHNACSKTITVLLIYKLKYTHTGINTNMIRHANKNMHNHGGMQTKTCTDILAYKEKLCKDILAYKYAQTNKTISKHAGIQRKICADMPEYTFEYAQICGHTIENISRHASIQTKYAQTSEHTNKNMQRHACIQKKYA